MFQVDQASAESNHIHGVIANLAMGPEAVDRELRRIANAERRLEHDKAHLLTQAVRLRIWSHFGRGSLSEYLEEVFGYTPKVAREHVRVAFAIEELPILGEMLESGEQSYTALRELSRVTTAETVAEWREAARGMNVRQVEELVAGHAKGDRPSDLKNPDLAIAKITLELRAGATAQLRQARQAISAEVGSFVDDSDLIETLCAAYFAGGEADQGRARHQLMITVCQRCNRGWQDAAGRVIAIDAVDVERAECDAQRIGSDREPERATQDITPMVRRFVRRRDHGKCCVPGCRASRNVDLHHVVHREHGGGHEAENLTLTCTAHHRALHEGKLLITGSAPNLTITYVNPPASSPALAIAPASDASKALRAARLQPQVAVPTPPVGRSKFESVVVVTQAKQALTSLGFRKAEAARYVDQALAKVDRPDLERLIRPALACSRQGVT